MTLSRPADSRPARLTIALTRTGALLLCAGGLLVASPSTVSGAARPVMPMTADDAKNVFYDGTHDEALAEVAGTDRTLVLYFTASWCGPCQRMQRTTWVDDQVIERLSTDGLVLRIDVDEQKELAQRYGIRAMPTMLALREGEEVNRVVGMRTAEQLLGWFDDASAMKAGDAAETKPIAENDAKARYARAKQYLTKNQFENALQDYQWLWENIPTREPSLVGVRTSFMTGDISKLCAQYAPAHAVFLSKRDESFAKLGQQAWTPTNVNEFVAINDALGEQEITLKWYEMLKDDQANERMLGYASSQLVPMLIERKRYAEAGRLMKNPVASAQTAFVNIVRSNRSVSKKHDIPQEFVDELLRNTATKESKEVIALFAAQRDDEATRVAEIIVKELGVMGREVLAQVAVEAGYVRPLHLSLLEGIEENERPDDYDDLVSKIQSAFTKQED